MSYDTEISTESSSRIQLATSTIYRKSPFWKTKDIFSPEWKFSPFIDISTYCSFDGIKLINLRRTDSASQVEMLHDSRELYQIKWIKLTFICDVSSAVQNLFLLHTVSISLSSFILVQQRRKIYLISFNLRPKKTVADGPAMKVGDEEKREDWAKKINNRRIYGKTEFMSLIIMLN